MKTLQGVFNPKYMPTGSKYVQAYWSVFFFPSWIIFIWSTKYIHIFIDSANMIWKSTTQIKDISMINQTEIFLLENSHTRKGQNLANRTLRIIIANARWMLPSTMPGLQVSTIIPILKMRKLELRESNYSQVCIPSKKLAHKL